MAAQVKSELDQEVELFSSLLTLSLAQLIHTPTCDPIDILYIEKKDRTHFAIWLEESSRARRVAKAPPKLWPVR